MMRSINKYVFPGICAALLGMAACDDWTQTESLEVYYPTLEEQNPALYAKYLEALRTYKDSEHKITLVGFDNPQGAPQRRDEHLTILPDSVDFICLENPDNLHPQFTEEFSAVRAMGTRLIYAVDYDAIETLWQEAGETGRPDASGGGDDSGQVPGTEDDARFLAFCREQTAAMLNLCGKYGYDGVVIRYAGRNYESLDEAERARYAARQNAFFTDVNGWFAAQGGKTRFFEGYPQNLIDKSVIAGCDYLIIPVLDAASKDDLTRAVRLSLVAGVPSERLIAGVTIASADDPSGKRGWFNGFEADGKTRLSAAKGAAEWAISDDPSFGRRGISIANAREDYFNVTKNFKNIREAIDIMNPAPKN